MLTWHLVPRCSCMVPTATFPWMTISQLQPKIWCRIPGRHPMTIRSGNSQIAKALRWWKQTVNCSKETFNRRYADSSDTLQSSDSVFLVTLPITSKVLLLLRMWHVYANTIWLWILPLEAFWPIARLQTAPKLHISCCEDRMPWLHGCCRICVLGGYFDSTL